MSIKLVVTGILAAVGVATAGLLTDVKAVVPPHIEPGNIYTVRNITKNTNFTDPVNAAKCEELQYRVRIHNPGPDEPLQNVSVKAVIPAAAGLTNTSTITVSASNAVPQSVSDTATVNLAAALKVNYVPGSSQLLNSAGGLISSIGDVTSGSGVPIGNVGISLNEIRYVQFKAKVDCPEEPVKSFKCEGLSAAKVSRTKYNFTATASVQNVTIQNYVFTAKNSAGQTVDTKTVTTGATTANYEFNQSAPGTYAVNVVVNTSEGATNPADCAKQVTVEEENAKSFKCEGLDVKQVSRTRYDFTARASVQNATIQSYVFKVTKDSNVVDTKTVTSSANSAEYKFDQSSEGTYVVNVEVKTSEGNTNPNDCAKQVTVVKEGETPPPPTTVTVGRGGGTSFAASSPAVLPEAGPTDVAAVVAIVTTISTIGYYTVSRRLI